ncbi:MAG: DUF393 domain-containing protein [Clostridia bacterium]|nr:DUF393 domain-containing protein [Clostridia bacterium]
MRLRVRFSVHWPPSPIEVYYDDRCPLCAAFRRRVEALDWLHLLRFRSSWDAGAARALDRSPDALAARLHTRCPATLTVRDGIEAVLDVCARVPLLMPLWPFLKLAALLGWGQSAYDFVAARRRILPAGACPTDRGSGRRPRCQNRPAATDIGKDIGKEVLQPWLRTRSSSFSPSASGR